MTAWRAIWAALAAAALAFAAFGPQTGLWPPEAMHLPMAGWISAAMAWLTDQAALGPVTFKDITRTIAAVIEAPYDLARILLVDGITTARAGGPRRSSRRCPGWPSPPPRWRWATMPATSGLVSWPGR